ncbi:MAG: cell surface protein SprA [Bacteroidota bacterium]|nr:cell surface protein SprA [Bacteroidota bacterium]
MKFNPNIRLKSGITPPTFLLIIIILFAISNVSFSQGRRDRPGGITNYNKSNSADTSQSGLIDSILALDSIVIIPVDSTARVKYFKYVPEYSYGTKLYNQKSPLLLDNPSNISYDVDFDSSGNIVVSENFDGENIKAPLVIPFDQYLSKLSEKNVKKGFSDIVNEKFAGTTQDDLSKLFEKFTDITIPLPFKSESIFGPPSLKLKINGAVDITASYQNATSEQTITTGLSNSNNSINFKQEVQLTAKGTVGDKLTIDADYNTQRLFDFENQLKIRYDGYADEVIKKIEGGNVSLETRSGLIGSSQALFGVKGDFQLGALSLSAVISQKKSKTEIKDYSGGAQEQLYSIKVWDYSENHYFLDTVYKRSFLNVFNDASVNNQTTLLSIDDQSFEVWVQTDLSNRDYRKASLYVNLDAIPPGGYADSLKSLDSTLQGISAVGIVRRLLPNEYKLNKYAGFVSLKISLPENYVVGVAYKRPNTGEQFGTISTGTGINSDDTLVLKMIKVENLVPSNTVAWELKLKNIYRLPLSRIVQEGFEFDVQFLTNGVYTPTLPISNISTNLITVLGLDKHTTGRSGGPDNKFDWIQNVTIDSENGFVIFPDLQPFYTNLAAYNINGQTIDSSFWYQQIYTELKSNADDKPNANNYAIVGKARGETSVSNTINLGFNIVVGSVSVKVGEIELALNSDYTVDYSTGTLVIRNSSALLSKDLKISYETNDLFTLASKTFLGLRGDYRISDKSSLGFTFVNLNQETLNDKVRIGEEPTNNSMFGIDFTTELPSKLLTNLVNLLPGYNTKEPSLITVRGELAAINPDPNTNKSQIPQDNNEAVAYIDDMEGAKKVISLGTTYNSWTLSSPPLESSIGLADTTRVKKRGKLKWYNIANSANLTDIYPLKDVQASQNAITPFYITFDPTRRGTYNYNQNYYADSIDNKSTTWNGIMKYLNTTSNDLINENINFIEFSMRVDNWNTDTTRNGKLIIDLGSISQDVILNRVVDTEDTLKNGELRSDQDDRGFDYQTDRQELEVYNRVNGTSLSLNDLPDPALDNNNPSGSFNVETINGTQNNLQFEGGRRPDTEDLNKTDNVLNPNDYFQFEISVNPTNNPYIVGDGAPGSGWYQYRIPLSEYTKAYGNATFTNIRFARMWMTGIKDTVRLEMYDLNLTGNQWIKKDKTDTTYNITVVSIEENPQEYSSPVQGDVLRQTIRGQNNIDTKSNEQSLSLEVFNLTNGVRKIARKDFSSIPLDLFNYRSMKLFVNGDPSFNYSNSTTYDAKMVIRFGNDSNNYYEYTAPIHPDVRAPGNNWNTLNDVTIDFADLTAIKLARDSSTVPFQTDTTNGPPGSQYKVFGNPDLQTIREIIIGVEKNRNSLNSAISGSVWFNELRLVNVIDNTGLAYNVSANMKLADLLDFNFAFSNVDPFFHSLDTRVGSRTTALSWDFSTTLNVHKILNNAFASIFSEEWSNFLTLPVTFRHTENMVNPRYFPGTDIELDQASEESYLRVFRQTGSTELATLASENIRVEAQSLSVRNSISISNMSFNLPSSNYLVKNIFNQLRFNFNSDFGNSRDLTYENKNDFRYTGGISLGTEFGLSDKLNLNIGNLIPLGEKYQNAKLYFFFPFIPLAPLFSTNFSASTDFNRSQSESKQRKYLTNDLTSRDFRANRGFRFDWKFIENWIVDVGGNYDFRVGSDLTPLVTDTLQGQRQGSEIFNDIFFNNGLVNFGEDLDYVQSIAINPKFNFPYIDRFISFNANYNVRYGWVNPNQTSNVGYNLGYQNQISSGATFKLKEIFSLFQGSDSKLQANGVARDTIKQESGNSQSIADILKLFSTFLPGDITATFTQSNQVANGGVTGLPGFGNFWFYPTTQENLGPSRLYQLGFSQYPGARAPGLQITDNYTIGNELSFSTTINPIFPETITMALRFNTNWGFANNLTYSSDSVTGFIGFPTLKSSNIYTGNTMFFAGNIETFDYQYEPDNSTANRQNITTSFQEKMASIPFPNWTLTLSGLEKFPFFSQFANSVTLDNSFVSEYKESKLIDIQSIDIPNSQAVTQAFSPLIGLNFNFKELLGGNLTSTFRLNTGKAYLLNPIGASIQSTTTNEWSINANFSKAGFSIPLFGLALQNDISFALTLSKITNEPVNYDYGTSGSGIPLPGNGSAVTTINPSIQYSLSSKVTMQLFYKYIKTQPTANASVTTVPRTSNEGGLNIRIAIQ